MSRYDEARAAVELGAMLPETAAAHMSGTLRSSKHPGTGYECEQAVITTTGEILSEWKVYARHLGATDLPAFERGWMKAMRGRMRYRCEGAEVAGWDAYPREKTVEPEPIQMEPYHHNWHDWRDDR